MTVVKQATRPEAQTTPTKGGKVRRLVFATNFSRLVRDASQESRATDISIRADGSWSDTLAIFRDAHDCDAIVLNIAAPTVLKLCLIRWLMPWLRWKLVSVDILLPRPVSPLQKVVAFVKRLLLRRVDLFILYFRDLTDYDLFYGIGRTRAAYVPFKSNSWERLPSESLLSSDGEYIITAGRTMRDLTTFIEAMKRVKYPAVLMYLKTEDLAVHGTTLPPDQLPPNVRLLEHDGNRETWISSILRAKVVVVPILPSTISSSGIGTSIDAMAMRKCVVISEGKATRGLLSDQAVVVPAEDPVALAEAIVLAWEDDMYRDRIASTGRKYASQLAGEDRLHGDIVAITESFLRGHV